MAALEESADDAVLTRILRSQVGQGKTSGPTVARALSEIQTGRKASHWIWYVWPTLKGTRTTQRPGLMLPNVEIARRYIQHETLGPRLLLITTVATKHLALGVRPTVLFGSSVDAQKFVEVCSCFYIAASSAVPGDMHSDSASTSVVLNEAAATFKEALVAARAGLDATTVDLALQQGWLIPPPPLSEKGEPACNGRAPVL